LAHGSTLTARLSRFGAVLASVLLSASATGAAGRAVTFSAPDGTTLAGTFYESSNRSAPAVVLVHMLARSKDEWIPLAERLQDGGATVLTFDLRGHGGSSGSASALTPMVSDVRSAVEWLTTRAPNRPSSIGLVGSSLGANLAALAAVDLAAVRAVALISPSLDYRGIRLDATVMKKLGARPVFLAASTEDPYALRTIHDLVAHDGAREQRLSTSHAHGTALLTADPDLTAALVDWLRRTLIF
jgi:alpha-beta hydrolase superfamily lysophospholipase